MLYRRFMRRRDEPIIHSLLDTDLYKFTTILFALHRYRDVLVRFGFTNRTRSVRLGSMLDIGEVREQLQYYRTLRFTEDEIAYLRTREFGGHRYFDDPAFLTFLREYSAPEFDVSIGQDGQLHLEVEGSWPFSSLPETPQLSIVTELFTERQLVGRSETEVRAVFEEGDRKLDEKLAMLSRYPELRFSDFGGRRRATRLWHRHVVERVHDVLPMQLTGTSNVRLAMDLGIPCGGTIPHEVDMVIAALADSDEELRGTHRMCLEQWWEEFGAPFATHLTDTFGTDFALSCMTDDQVRNYGGYRQDSRDPFVYGEDVIKFLRSRNTDPGTKRVTFSDGLTHLRMIELHERFHRKFGDGYGWGSHLTNDVGLQTLSTADKVILVNGRDAVKLSDNLAKAIGGPAEIARYKRVFGYDTTYAQRCEV